MKKNTFLLLLVFFISCNHENKIIDNTSSDYKMTSMILNRFDIKMDTSIKMVFEYYKSFDTSFILIVNKNKLDFLGTLKEAFPKYQFENNLFLAGNDSTSIYRNLEFRFKISDQSWNIFLKKIDNLNKILPKSIDSASSYIHPPHYTFYFNNKEMSNTDFRNEYFFQVSALIKSELIKFNFRDEY